LAEFARYAGSSAAYLSQHVSVDDDEDEVAAEAKGTVFEEEVVVEEEL
jgi:hypothetical protein